MINTVPQDPRPRQRAGCCGVRGVVVLMIAASALPEIILWGADAGLWGAPRWRMIALEYGAFWGGLLGNWQPNYPLQPYAMFLSYGFLHAGPVHFTVNMVTLLSLAPPILARVGPWRLVGLYGASLIGGAAAFAALGQETAPMVGASGALFGLAGAYLAWEWSDRRAARQSLRPVVRTVLLLAALNLVLWWAMAGALAWQTHLGGFVAGWAMVSGPLRHRP